MMELNQFIKNFADQFDETDQSEFTSETIFKDLEEWSSLMALSVIAMVNEEYDINIGAQEIMSSITIESLFNSISEKS